MLKFPCLLFRENKIVHSREELIDRLNEARAIGKSCEVGIYAFSAWENLHPIPESVVLDKKVYRGSRENLEQLAEKKLREDYESILIYDGENYLLFVGETVESREDLEKTTEQGVTVITRVEEKFVFPGFHNLKTGQLSKIIKRWKV